MYVTLKFDKFSIPIFSWTEPRKNEFCSIFSPYLFTKNLVSPPFSRTLRNIFIKMFIQVFEHFREQLYVNFYDWLYKYMNM